MKDKLKGVAIAMAVLAALAVGGVAIAGATGGDDEDDQAITGSALKKASSAALDHTNGGKVTGTEVGDEESYYEVEVTRPDGSQVDVQLDHSFDVVGSEGDDDGAGDDENDED
jgi:uncharacterized membrane protein YkoI